MSHTNAAPENGALVDPEQHAPAGMFQARIGPAILNRVDWPHSAAEIPHCVRGPYVYERLGGIQQPLNHDGDTR
jgi:hypothetical protein